MDVRMAKRFVRLSQQLASCSFLESTGEVTCAGHNNRLKSSALRAAKHAVLLLWFHMRFINISGDRQAEPNFDSPYVLSWPVMSHAVGVSSLRALHSAWTTRIRPHLRYSAGQQELDPTAHAHLRELQITPHDSSLFCCYARLLKPA